MVRAGISSKYFNVFSDKLRFYTYGVRIATSVLTKRIRKCKTPVDHLNLCYNAFQHTPFQYVGLSIAPLQIREEIQALLSILNKEKIQFMLEIGTSNGGTLYLFAQTIDSNARIISLDLPMGRFGGGYKSFKIPLFTNFAQNNQHIFLVRADSHLSASSTTVKTILKGHKLDFLFLDGDHTYNGVKKDFQMYRPLVRRGGLIAFHDICEHDVSEQPFEMGCQVHRFWNEIKREGSYQEIIHDQNQNWAGIGVLYI